MKPISVVIAIFILCLFLIVLVYIQGYELGKAISLSKLAKVNELKFI